MKANMNLYITRTITDTKTGKVIKRYRKKQAKSFVKQWMQMIELALAHAHNSNSDSITIKDMTGGEGTGWGTSETKLYFAAEAPANNDSYGILIGTGTTAPAIADYTIETQIMHGVGAGEMQHGACSVQSAGIVGPSMELNIIRAFINGSGNTITVKEVGLVVTFFAPFYLIIHDAVNDPVADTQTYTITYTFRTTV